MSSKTRVPLAPLSLSVVLGVLLGAGRQDRERRGFQIEAEEVELFADEMLLCVGMYTHTPVTTNRLIQQDCSVRDQYINNMYFCTLEMNKESKKTVLFIIAPETTKSLGI